MFLTTHAAAGILIGHTLHDPLAVFGVSFASHFVLDFIPHGDEELYRDYEWKVLKKYTRPMLVNAIDVACLIGLTLWAISTQSAISESLVAIGILGSILPDFLSFLFPVLHEKLSWLNLARWIYAATKPTGLRYLVRGQDRIHKLFHHEIIRRDVPLWTGVTLQAALTVVLLVLSRG